MSDLRELYQQVILDHNKAPRNYREITPCDHEADGYNPLCGDKVHIYIALDGETIADVAFQGEGCAISKASASMMTDALKGKTIEEARALFDEFQAMITCGLPAPGKLAVFAGVRDYPMRVKCATLAWHTMKAALEGKTEAATTE
ncbi:MAG: Fe-S cluster assembly sulfur transfer protein SufU [Planctomycetota bacterium]|jgi:nitrogen fixation NifU-like protein